MLCGDELALAKATHGCSQVYVHIIHQLVYHATMTWCAKHMRTNPEPPWRHGSESELSRNEKRVYSRVYIKYSD
jgi:hypothetical protein